MFIPKAAFAVSKVASKDNIRYAFAAISVQRLADGKARAVATDGRRMMIASWDDKTEAGQRVDNFASLIARDDFDNAGKADGTRAANRVVNRSVRLDEPSANGTVALQPGYHIATDYHTTGPALTARTADAIFPRVDDAIPTYQIITPHKDTYKRPGAAAKRRNMAVEIHVNAKMLREMLQAMEAQIGGSCHRVKLTVPLLHNRPIRLDASTGDGTRYVGVLMPVDPQAD